MIPTDLPHSVKGLPNAIHGNPLPTQSVWQGIKQTFGRSFSKIIDFPIALYKLALRIALFFFQIKSKNFEAPVQKPADLRVPNYRRVSPQQAQDLSILHEALPKLEEVGKKLNEVQKIEQGQIKTEKTEQAAETPPSVEMAPITNTRLVSGKPINVPDDGNCLLYSLAVGIGLKYPEFLPKLNWTVSPSRLTGDLSHQANLLKEPAQKLREEAAQFAQKSLLEQDDNSAEILTSLLGGIVDHNAVMKKQVDEEEMMVPFLIEEIEDLREREQTEEVIALIKQKEDQIGSTQSSIERQKSNVLDNPDDPELPSKYLELSKTDHFYCGIAQIFSLSLWLNIPIRVLRGFKSANVYEREEIFKPLHALESPKGIITVCHVNGNHFMYLDD